MSTFSLLVTSNVAWGLLLLPVIALIGINITPSHLTTPSIRSITRFALLITILNFVLVLVLLHFYDSSSAGFQYKLYIGDRLFGGLDGISLWLIFLVNLITPIVILSSWRTIEIMPKNYLNLILLINLLSILVFLVLDILLFYIAFEAILIPMYYLIGYYGSRNRKIDAQNTFFLYTLWGSLFLLLSI
jgi:NADH-ubiquinone oxidoreductase chain 4